MFLQTQNHSDDTPPDSTTLGASTSVMTTPLTISKIPIEPLLKVAKGPNRRAGNYSKVAHNYIIVDDLAQLPAAMSMLEVLQLCPKQRKSLLSALGTINPSDRRIMSFDLDKATPRIPSMVSFQILVSIKNITIHQCVIDEGA